MKKIISFVVLLSALTSAQSNQNVSIAELKRLSAIRNQRPASSNEQLISDFPFRLDQSSMQHLSSSIQYQESSSKKSSGLAILYSLLLPGMGELYAGSYDNGKYFTITDGVLWSFFSGFYIYGNQQADNYKAFAQANAGVKLDSKDSEYFANISIYQNIEDYNTAMELKRKFGNTYNSSTHYWKWSDQNLRREYREMWLSSEQAYNNLRFIAGALILNRVISAVNAVRLVNAFNKNLTEELSWNLSIRAENKPTLPSFFTLNFVTSF